jgi:hypothetical protein
MRMQTSTSALRGARGVRLTAPGCRWRRLVADRGEALGDQRHCWGKLRCAVRRRMSQPPPVRRRVVPTRCPYCARGQRGLRPAQTERPQALPTHTRGQRGLRRAQTERPQALPTRARGRWAARCAHRPSPAHWRAQAVRLTAPTTRHNPERLRSEPAQSGAVAVRACAIRNVSGQNRHDPDGRGQSRRNPETVPAGTRAPTAAQTAAITAVCPARRQCESTKSAGFT